MQSTNGVANQITCSLFIHQSCPSKQSIAGDRRPSYPTATRPENRVGGATRQISPHLKCPSHRRNVRVPQPSSHLCDGLRYVAQNRVVDCDTTESSLKNASELQLRHNQDEMGPFLRSFKELFKE